MKDEYELYDALYISYDTVYNNAIRVFQQNQHNKSTGRKLPEGATLVDDINASKFHLQKNGMFASIINV